MNINLMNGDCLELMKSIPDKSIELICCDLPYGTTDTHGGKKSKNRTQRLKIIKNFPPFFFLKFSFSSPIKGWW